jgi:AhpD family alkylhydroperoxidase
MYMNWQEGLGNLSEPLKELRAGAPDVMKGFSAVAHAALKPGVLGTKTKELIAIAISVAARCDDCIGFHVKAALAQGATREEILETLSMAIYMGAGPSVMYASHVLDAYGQMAQASSSTEAT